MNEEQFYKGFLKVMEFITLIILLLYLIGAYIAMIYYLAPIMVD